MPTWIENQVNSNYWKCYMYEQRRAMYHTRKKNLICLSNFYIIKKPEIVININLIYLLRIMNKIKNKYWTHLIQTSIKSYLKDDSHWEINSCYVETTDVANILAFVFVKLCSLLTFSKTGGITKLCCLKYFTYKS